MISNFITTADLPKAVLPSGVQDIQRYNLGFLYEPIDTYIALRNGNEFWIKNGVVQSFLAPESLHGYGHSARPTATTGSSLSSNQVVVVANGLLKRLVRGTNVPPLSVPEITADFARSGDGVPFYHFVWFSTNSHRYSAALEIDAVLAA
jgi:hypothetical protein